MLHIPYPRPTRRMEAVMAHEPTIKLRTIEEIFSFLPLGLCKMIQQMVTSERDRSLDGVRFLSVYFFFNFRCTPSMEHLLWSANTPGRHGDAFRTRSCPGDNPLYPLSRFQRLYGGVAVVGGVDLLRRRGTSLMQNLCNKYPGGYSVARTPSCIK